MTKLGGGEDNELEGEAGDPAAAFDALRRAIETQGARMDANSASLRASVEAALENIGEHGPSQDITRELAKAAQQLGVIGERLHGVEQSPMLRQGAQHYAQMFERSGKGLVQDAAQQLERRAIELGRVIDALSAHVASARERSDQNRRLWIAGAAGVVIGVLLPLFLPRMAPEAVGMTIASTALNVDRWTAGGKLMQSGDPENWNYMVAADKFVRANHDDLKSCADAAVRTKKDQRCTITVPAPAK